MYNVYTVYIRIILYEHLFIQVPLRAFYRPSPCSRRLYLYYNVLLHARTNTRVYRNREKHGKLSVSNLGTFLFYFPQHDNLSNTMQYTYLFIRVRLIRLIHTYARIDMICLYNRLYSQSYDMILVNIRYRYLRCECRSYLLKIILLCLKPWSIYVYACTTYVHQRLADPGRKYYNMFSTVERDPRTVQCIVGILYYYRC